MSLKGTNDNSQLESSSTNATVNVSPGITANTTNQSLRVHHTPRKLTRLRSSQSFKQHDINYENPHLPSQGLLDATYNTSIRSPRISYQSSTNDFFGITQSDENTHLKASSRPLLLRQHSIQQSIYGSTGNRKNDDILEETMEDSSILKTNYYDDFTTIDWLDNSIKQSERLSHLTRLSRRSFKHKIRKNFDSAKSWILIVIISFLSACLAYSIDTVENVLIDLKRGYCAKSWIQSESACCLSTIGDDSPVLKPFSIRINDQETLCPDFHSWSSFFATDSHISFEFVIYLVLTLSLAFVAVHITLLTKTTNPLLHNNNSKDSSDIMRPYTHKVWYTAYGSGVPEVKTILSGFIIRRFLGTWTLICKASSLVLAIASGMALGKEGPYVHLSACIGNICCRIFKKINRNELEKRQILSAASSAGVALAFGSPLGAVLFSIEEVTYYLPINQLFHIFFCAMSSTLFLKFLNPYGTGKTVFFEVEYSSDWEPVELIFFIFIGVAGGCFGAGFCLFTQWWGNFFRSKSIVKDKPVTEVLLIAALTALTTYYNKYTKIPTTELLYELLSPCTIKSQCPILENKQLSDAGGITVIKIDNIVTELQYLLIALAIKLVLTSVTFGLKLPAGIYVPSMVIGALFGRLFAMLLQYIVIVNPDISSLLFTKNNISPTAENVTCVDFGIYAMIGAGAFMAGVTRMNVTLAAILFELTSSYTYVLPISISIAISNWVANMIEPYSLYELLISKNDFPFLDNRSTPVFIDKTTRVIDLIPHSTNQNYVIDITDSPHYPASILQSKLKLLQQNSLLDGCLSIVKNHGDTILGLLPAPLLEFQLDKLERFTNEYGITDEIFVKLSFLEEEEDDRSSSDIYSMISDHSRPQEEIVTSLLNKLTDFTRIIDYNPIYLDYDSRLSLVYSIFSKLGNREICILDEDGKFCGTLHKKVFIDYCKKEKTKY